VGEPISRAWAKIGSSGNDGSVMDSVPQHTNVVAAEGSDRQCDAATKKRPKILEKAPWRPRALGSGIDRSLHDPTHPGSGEHPLRDLSLGPAWPLMMIPTWAAWRYDWGLYWAWGFARLYIIAMGLIFLLRFRTGIWKSMRVIETTVVEEPMAALEPEPEGQPA
jgi:hypothetical protein